MASSMLGRDAKLETQKKVPMFWMVRTLPAFSTSPSARNFSKVGSSFAPHSGLAVRVLPVKGLPSWRRAIRCEFKLNLVAETPPAAARPAARRSPVRMVKTREEDKWFEDEEKGYHKGRSFIVRELMIFYNDHQLNNRRKLSYGLAICM